MGTYLSTNGSVIWQAFLQHLWLALIPVVIGSAVSLPLGYLAVRYRWLYQTLMAIFGILYSIPSLALIVLLPAVLGTKILSPVNIIVALSIYTAALMVRSVADALNSVDPVVLQAATAMGFQRGRRFRDVELPVALPVIFGGLRVATVANVSIVSVGALIGIGGLGQLFTDGFQRFYTPPIVVGIVLSVALALALDGLIVLTQRGLTPWLRAAGR